MFSGSKSEIIKNHPLFDSLSWWDTRSVASQSQIVEIPKGEVLLREDQPGDAFYLVISGRCEAYSVDDEGREHTLEHYYNGDSFGEVSLLSDEPNWCNVRTLNDTLLLKLHRDDFNQLVNSNAELSHRLSQKVASRLQNKRDEESKSKKYSKIITFGSAMEEIGKTLLGINVAVSLQKETDKRICVVDFSRHANDLEIQDMPTSTDDMAEWVEEVAHEHPSGIDVIPGNLPKEINKDYLGPFFGAFMTNFDYVFVILPEGLSPVELEVYEQSDEIYLLTDLENQNIYQTRLLINQIEEKLGEDMTEIQVILSRLDDRDLRGVSGVEENLDRPVSYRLPELSTGPGLSPLRDEAFINHNSGHRFSQNVKRIARQIGNVSVGLALGAGAARGLSHIGVIRMLEEENILVDMVAGTSIGALVAAGWATGASADEMEEYAYEFKRRGGLWTMSDLSFPPTQSILRDTRIENFLDFMLGDATFSDTQFPTRIMTANLDTLEETVIKKGLLKDAVRSSISIPMMFPPEKRGDDLFVDGGVLNPIPVEPLIKQGVGKIIAVNPIPPIEVLQESRHSSKGKQTSSGFFGWLQRQLLPFGRGNIIDVFMRSLQAMQARLATSSSTGADVLIRPIMSSEEWFEFEEVDSFIRQGELTAEQQIEEIKELIRTGTTDTDDAMSIE